MPGIQGIIVERKGERAKVKTVQNNSEVKNLPKYLDCWNKIEAKEGMKVKIEMQELDEKKARMIIYSIPTLFALAGATFGKVMASYFSWDIIWTIIGSTIFWLFMGLTYTATFRRDAVRKGEQPVIVDVIYD
ncbi:MAG: SoxR reducing system RseC family protein [Acidaminococcaceae bacterium]